VAVLGLGFACTAVLLVLLPHRQWIVLPAAALLGGFLATLYPVCVALAHDCMPADLVVAVSARLILVSGLGSVLGPVIGTRLMTSYDINGVFYFMATVALALALAAWLGSLRTAPPLHQERPFDILPPQASPLAHATRSCSDVSSSVGHLRATAAER